MSRPALVVVTDLIDAIELAVVSDRSPELVDIHRRPAAMHSAAVEARG